LPMTLTCFAIPSWHWIFFSNSMEKNVSDVMRILLLSFWRILCIWVWIEWFWWVLFLLWQIVITGNTAWAWFWFKITHC
jgi:hypothetical protein